MSHWAGWKAPDALWMPIKPRRKVEDLLYAAGGGTRLVGAALSRVLLQVVQGYGDLELVGLPLGKMRAI